ncbi:hypothetical protein J4214_03620 [Candidatus Woesearchaeota archaeon]|nr:hypothetical protein [Candidatus Woesearchaeota archaeon]
MNILVENMVLFIPLPGLKHGTVKDYIIKILGEDWPLTPKKMYFIAKKKYGISCTYQAVFKGVNELLKEEVVTKSKEGYSINLEWIKRLQSYTDTIETNYYAKERVMSLEGIQEVKDDKDIRLLVFNNYFDVEKYLYYFIKHIIFQSNKRLTQYRYVSHEWRPFFYLRTEYLYIERLKEKKHRLVVMSEGNSYLDRYFLNIYNKLNVKVKFSKHNPSLIESYLVDDYFIQVHLPEEIMNRMDVLYKKTKKISEVNIQEVINEIFSKKMKIKMVINHDTMLAKKMEKIFKGILQSR